jgi:membrane protease YdiL (CAAX protease family)
VLAVLAVALWAGERRAWGALGLALPHAWRLLVSALAVAAMAILVVRQNAVVRRMSAERAAKLAPRFAGLEFIVPHTAGEYRWFIAVSWTAGICEELLYRGVLTWVITSYVGVVAAQLIAAAVFGLAHAYQGPKGIVKTGAVGLVMGLIVLATGWLCPAMIIHALVDLASGTAGFAVFGGTRGVAVSALRGAPVAKAASLP